MIYSAQTESFTDWVTRSGATTIILIYDMF
jgi:hypothetical protein